MGLRQVSTATKWIAGVAAVLTGFFTVWEARSVHNVGASTPATPSPSTVPLQPSTSGSADAGSSSPGSSDPGSSNGSLQAPASAPAPSDQQPAARSGGS